MEVATLIIAVFGAVTGAASLGWGVASYVLSGGRVKVEVLGGWFGPGGLMSGPLTVVFARRDESFPEPVLGVRVRNLGRLPVVVENWSVNMGQIGVALVSHRMNAATPKTLAPGESETWVVPLEAVVAAVEAADHVGLRSEELRATVSLGTGRSRVSRHAPVRTSELLKRFGYKEGGGSTHTN